MELRHRANGTRGLYATQSYKRGQIVLIEMPLVTASGPLANWHLTMKFLRRHADLPTDEWAPGSTGCGWRAWDAEDERQLDLCVRSGIDKQEAKHMYDIMCTNSICANPVYKMSPDGTPPARVLGYYKTLSMLNHACVHNCVWRHNFQRTDHALHLVVVRDIAEGEELTVNYMVDGFERLESRELRREILLKEFGFVCECAKCMN